MAKPVLPPGVWLAHACAHPDCNELDLDGSRNHAGYLCYHLQNHERPQALRPVYLALAEIQPTHQQAVQFRERASKGHWSKDFDGSLRDPEDHDHEWLVDHFWIRVDGEIDELLTAIGRAVCIQVGGTFPHQLVGTARAGDARYYEDRDLPPAGRRLNYVVYARQWAWALARELTKHPDAVIGEAFGGFSASAIRSARARKSHTIDLKPGVVRRVRRELVENVKRRLVEIGSTITID